jgi:hypothetical protein
LQISPQQRLPTGNDVVSIPSLSAADASAAEISVLSMRHRGPVELHGSDKDAFFRPSLRLGAKAIDLGREKQLKVSRLEHWVPEYSLSDAKTFALQLKVIAPLSARGFILDYSVKNLGSKPLKAFLGAQGCFAGLRARGGDVQKLSLWREARQFSGLAARHLVLASGAAAPEFALAIGASEDLDVMEAAVGSAPKGAPKWAAKSVKVDADSSKGIFWQAGKNLEIKPGETVRFGLYFGLGVEALSAAASCVELRRQGLSSQVDSTLRFLNRRVRFTGDSHLDQVMNLNQWFNYFYAMGVTLDSEDFVCLSSRSPHYHAAGAYRDRDAMLWSFPAVLMIDTHRARRMLDCAFGIQGRNVGARSRFLDGVALEPGFELDGLCAPIIALANYVKNTGDQGLLKDFSVRKVLRNAERLLQGKKHPSQALYETQSGPDGALEPLPYLAYSNVLAWRAQIALAELKPRMGRDQDVAGHKELAERIKSAVWKHFTLDSKLGRTFAWASDLRGGHRFGTAPSGCLQLLPYFGFCEPSEGVWRNTVSYLHSKDYTQSFSGAVFEEIGGAGSQPSTLSICNRLLSGQRDKAKALLDRMDFDGGIACESFDAVSGKPRTGFAFAAGAGFLAWSLWKAFGRAESVSSPRLAPQAQPQLPAMPALSAPPAPLPTAAVAKAAKTPKAPGKKPPKPKKSKR